MQRLVALVEALVLCLALAACGSTVRHQAQEPLPGDDALGAPAVPTGTAGASLSGGRGTAMPGSSTSSVVAGTTAGASTGGTGGARPSGSGGTSTADAGPTGGSGAAASPAAPAQPPASPPLSSSPSGVADAPAGGGAPPGLATGEPVVIGVVAPNYAAVAVALGGEGTTSDVFRGYRAMFEKINAEGGLEGHPVEALYYFADPADPSAPQAACAFFTEDNQVHIVISEQYSVETFLTCVSDAGIAVMDTNRWAYDSHTMDEQFPGWFPIASMAMDRYMRTTIDVAVETGGLQAGDIVGVLREDCPSHQRVYADVVQPLAERHGLTLEEAAFTCGNGNTASAGDMAAQIQSAVLRFRAVGVTKVMAMSAAEGFVFIVFTRSASQQQYYPNYVLTSNAFPYSNSDPNGAVAFAADSLANMSGVGWAPIMDVGPNAPATAEQAAVQARCAELDPTLAGFTETEGQRKWEKAYFFYAECDVVRLIGALMASSDTHFGVADIQQAFPQAAAGFVSAALLDGIVSTAAGRRDGAAAVHAYTWDADCPCFMGDARRWSAE